MPQVHLENSASNCAGGSNDSKTNRDAQAEDGSNGEPTENDVIPDDTAAANMDPDFPPESFWLSKDAEYDWFDRNALYERKDSAKRNSNSTNLNPNINPSLTSNSQRSSISLKSKASIIGLPKTQKATYIDSKRKTSKPANVRLFPKRSGKSTVSAAEPGSPKVSCMGRVRSKRGRRRSNSVKRKEKPTEKLRGGGENQKTGFYSKVISLFRSEKGRKKPPRSGSRKVAEEPVKWKSVSSREREIPAGGEPVVEAPGLGGVRRFASGRRSNGSWTAEDI